MVRFPRLWGGGPMCFTLRSALSASARPKISLSFDKEIRSLKKGTSHKADTRNNQTPQGILITSLELSIFIPCAVKFFCCGECHAFIVFDKKNSHPFYSCLLFP